MQLVTHRRVELIGGSFVDEHVRSRQRQRVGRAAIGRQDRTEYTQVPHVNGSHVHEADALARGQVCDRSSFHDHWYQAVDFIEIYNLVAKRTQALDRKIGVAARQAQRTAQVRGQQLVDLAQALDRVDADAVVDCIAGPQSRRHDQGAEHQSHDDECGLGGPAGDVAQADLEDNSAK